MMPLEANLLAEFFVFDQFKGDIINYGRNCFDAINRELRKDPQPCPNCCVRKYSYKITIMFHL